MHIVPLISLKKGQLCDGYNGLPLSLEDLFARIEKDAMLYVLDYDGLERSNPNLEMYQRLTEHCVLWIDNGPRRIDDVMDTIMAGATNLSLQPSLWPDLMLADVFELTDDEVFLVVDASTRDAFPPAPLDITGVVLFQGFQQDTEFITTSFLKDKASTLKTYLYTAPASTIPYWEERGITGLLVDFNKKEDYR
jgi:hypothetical protein